MKVLKPKKINTAKQESRQSSDGTELIDRHIFIIALGERKKTTFSFAYFVSDKVIADPLLACLVPQMGGCSSSLPPILLF